MRGSSTSLESTAAHPWTRHFVTGLVPWSASEPPGLSPDARADRVDELESTASGGHAPTQRGTGTRHYVAGLVP
jgi:hypothetical protein